MLSFLDMVTKGQRLADADVAAAPASYAGLARQALAAYRGTSPFVRDVARRAGLGLTTRQVRAVINAIADETARATETPAVTPAAAAPSATQAPLALPQRAQPPKGFYTVAFNGSSADYDTLRLKPAPQGWANCPAGTLVLGLLTGPMNTASYTNLGTVAGGQFRPWNRCRPYLTQRVLAAIEAVLGGQPQTLTAYGTAYATASGRCYRCGKTLTTPESLRLSIGPECRGRENPAKRRARRAA